MNSFVPLEECPDCTASSWAVEGGTVFCSVCGTVIAR